MDVHMDEACACGHPRREHRHSPDSTDDFKGKCAAGKGPGRCCCARFEAAPPACESTQCVIGDPRGSEAARGLSDPMGADPELALMEAVVDALRAIGPDAVLRVLKWAEERASSDQRREFERRNEARDLARARSEEAQKRERMVKRERDILRLKEKVLLLEKAAEERRLRPYEVSSLKRAQTDIKELESEQAEDAAGEFEEEGYEPSDEQEDDPEDS